VTFLILETAGLGQAGGRGEIRGKKSGPDEEASDPLGQPSWRGGVGKTHLFFRKRAWFVEGKKRDYSIIALTRVRRVVVVSETGGGGGEETFNQTLGQAWKCWTKS